MITRGDEVFAVDFVVSPLMIYLHFLSTFGKDRYYPAQTCFPSAPFPGWIAISLPCRKPQIASVSPPSILDATSGIRRWRASVRSRRSFARF